MNPSMTKLDITKAFTKLDKDRSGFITFEGKWYIYIKINIDKNNYFFMKKNRIHEWSSLFMY